MQNFDNFAEVMIRVPKKQVNLYVFANGKDGPWI